MTLEEALRRIVEAEESRRERRALAEQEAAARLPVPVAAPQDRIDDRRWE
jgi:hypothetical protein